MISVDSFTIQNAMAASRRILLIEEEILAMPEDLRNWFMSKPGHKDAFGLARFVLRIIKEDEENEQYKVGDDCEKGGHPWNTI